MTELVLSFEGPRKQVRPDRCEAAPLLRTALDLIRLIERIGEHASTTTDEPEFAVTLTELRAGSVKFVLGFTSRHGPSTAAAAEAGVAAAQLAPKYLASPKAGPAAVRKRVDALASSLTKLPTYVKAHLRGTVEADLSALVQAEVEGAFATSVETFRATILRAGGTHPRVQLKFDGRTFTFDAPQEIAKQAGATLYAEADVMALLQRDADQAILHGVIQTLRVLEPGDPVDAIDQWYEASGKPWAKVKDIEKALGRRKLA
ncbi:MAG: hypothetical protein HOO96_40395 [Polyangiaceae bacterium]|nr:hypothetical protein [Polyangiaceae bacterium]